MNEREQLLKLVEDVREQLKSGQAAFTDAQRAEILSLLRKAVQSLKPVGGDSGGAIDADAARSFCDRRFDDVINGIEDLVRDIKGGSRETKDDAGAPS